MDFFPGDADGGDFYISQIDILNQHKFILSSQKNLNVYDILSTRCTIIDETDIRIQLPQ